MRRVSSPREELSASPTRPARPSSAAGTSSFSSTHWPVPSRRACPARRPLPENSTGAGGPVPADRVPTRSRCPGGPGHGVVFHALWSICAEGLAAGPGRDRAREPVGRPAMLDVARATEDGPFESIWVYDHFHTVPGGQGTDAGPQGGVDDASRRGPGQRGLDAIAGLGLVDQRQARNSGRSCRAAPRARATRRTVGGPALVSGPRGYPEPGRFSSTSPEMTPKVDIRPTASLGHG